jgi:hypothetical protein
MSIVSSENELIPRRYRGGIIPYYIHNNDIHFCFGVDRKYNEYTDFGGGIKKNESTMEGSLREFHEESSESFGVYTEKDLKSAVVLYNHRILIYFLAISKDIADKAISTFPGNGEISEIVSMTVNTLRELLTRDNNHGRPIYRVVKKCFSEIYNVEDFLSMLRDRSI